MDDPIEHDDNNQTTHKPTDDMANENASSNNIDAVTEPTDTATKPENMTIPSEQEPSTTSTNLATETIERPNSAPISPIGRRPLPLVIAAGIIFILLIALGTWWMLSSRQSSESESQDTALVPVEKPKLGIALTLINGVVEYSEDGALWNPATMETVLNEGNYIKTGTDGMAIIALDDGSAVRLNSSSSIRFFDLTADNIKIEQLSGMVYSRVVPDLDRKYSVTTKNTAYEALGTAFLTFNTKERRGVQVFESSVKTDDISEPISEGKQYFEDADEISDIDIDTLVSDSFVTWNLEEDEKSELFKERLGMLPKIKERAEEIEAERKAAEEERRLQAERDAALQEAKRKEAEENEKKKKAEAKVERGNMALTQKDGTFKWSYTGKAVHGYKLVYSNKTTKPVLEKHSSVYFSDINTMSGTLPKNTARGTYYVRVCAYTAGTQSEQCVDYSNFVRIRIN